MTGRSNYQIAGYEGSPEIVSQPLHAAVASARYWRHNGLNERSARELDYNGFYALVGRVNAKHLGVADRWDAYQRALIEFGVKKAPK